MLIKTGITLALLSSPCFACQPGKFGSNCMQTCSTHCSGNGSCNQITGDCDNGCKDGWTGSKCGIQQNTGMSQTDGSTDSFITITIGSSVAGVSGVGITAGIAVCLFRRKNASIGKKNSNPSTSNDNRTYHYHIHNPTFNIGDGAKDEIRFMKGTISTSELLAINPSA